MAVFIPATDNAGAAQLPRFIYSNAVCSELIRLGAKWLPEGLAAFIAARQGTLRVNQDAGISPEDTARDLCETFRMTEARRTTQADQDRAVLHRAIEDSKRRGRWNIPLT